MCFTPFFRKDDPTTPLPCGKCERCAKRRASAWSFRLRKHSEIANTAWFVTLTYDTDHVKFSQSGRMTLVKRDVQLFMKRLRKYSGQKDLRYYAVGEYGSKRWRPHYHIILFNLISPYKWCGKTPEGHDLFKVAHIDSAWKFGDASCGRVSDATVGYTLKYLSKPKRVPAYSGDDRCREFSLMSKRLGANYLSPAMVRWHKADLKERMYVPLPDGKKISMPRYFKDKIYTDVERSEIAAHAKNRIADQQQKDIAVHGDRVQHVRDLMALQAAKRMSSKMDKPSNF